MDPLPAVLATLLVFQSLLGLALLLPRAASKPVASLLSVANTNTAAKSALLTISVAIATMTGSSLVQLLGVLDTLKRGSQFGDRALALTIEELRSLLVLALGSANLVILFLGKALAAEQLAGDKARLNLEVLQRQAKGLQAEYNRATSAAAGGGPGAAGDDEAARLKSRVDSLIREKDGLQAAAEAAEAAKRSAEAKVEAIQGQSKGLEREYDRLLAEHDRLRRDYEQAIGGRAGGGKKLE